jgi:hypothetical protein
MLDHYRRAIEKEFQLHQPRVTVLGTSLNITLECRLCGEVTTQLHQRFPPEKARKVLVGKGWRFHGREATCPKCAKAAIKHKDDKAMANEQPPLTSEAAKVARRIAIRWLDEAFDVAKGRYREGMNDEQIASETGLSAKAIADLRAEFGYDFKEPEEIAEWRHRITEAGRQLDECERGAKAMFAAIKADLHKLSAEIDKVCERNNW